MWLEVLTYPSTNEWISCGTYIMEYYSAMKRETLTFATWMDLESIVLSEISQIEKDKFHMISLTHGI